MSADERSSRPADLTDAQWMSVLVSGVVEVEGRLPWSSNATFLARVSSGDEVVRAVYKPRSGERELWDFPDGLCRREIAAFELNRALRLGVVPATVLRTDVPFGEGSLQRFIDADFAQHYFSLREVDAHHEALRTVAAFDLLANNADRKGGHLLVDRSHRVWAIDNGLSFHVEAKLRTVMWDFIGDEIPLSVVDGARRLVDSVPDALSALLSRLEVEALVERARQLVANPRFPEPDDEARLPWPLV